MRRKLVFWTALNSYQSSKLLRNKPEGMIHPVETEEWTNKRIDLWRRFTLKSILNQTYEDFLYIVLLDPNLKHLTAPRLPRRPDRRVIYCYKDKPVLRLLHEYDEIIFTLIDGDDMYAREAGKIMMSCPDEWMYFRRGYAYEMKRKQLWTYDTIGTGPFWAWRRAPKEMIRFDREKRHPTHKAVFHRSPTELADGNFCVLLHENNTSSTIKMRNVQKKVDTKIIGEKFGIES